MTSQDGLTDACKNVVITGIDLNRDFLEALYSNRTRSGGGKIDGIHMYPTKRTAIITFCQEKDAIQVVKQKHVVVKDRKYSASWPEKGGAATTQRDKTKASGKTVHVYGIGDLDREMLSLLYTHPSRSGGGEIDSLVMETDRGYALIKFKTTEAAVRVVEHGVVTWNDHKLTASWPTDGQLVKVSNIGDLDADTLSVIYTNRHKSGGGAVDTVDLKTIPECALIAFKHPDDAAQVVHRKQVHVGGQVLTATWFDQTVRGDKTQVVISGLGEYDVDDLKLMYSSKKSTGGGRIADISVDSTLHTAIITFEDVRDAQAVVQQKEAKFGDTLLMANWVDSLVRSSSQRAPRPRPRPRLSSTTAPRSASQGSALPGRAKPGSASPGRASPDRKSLLVDTDAAEHTNDEVEINTDSADELAIVEGVTPHQDTYQTKCISGFSVGKLQFLFARRQEGIECIRQKYGVTISISPSSDLLIQGMSDVLDPAEHELMVMSAKVCCASKSLPCDPGGNFVSSAAGRDELSMLEREHTVLYRLKDESKDTLPLPHIPRTPPKAEDKTTPKVPDECVIVVNGITLKVMEGDFINFTCDALVNPTNPKLELKHGRISGQLLEKAGPGIQSEVSKKYPKNIDAGKVAVSDGYRLNCKRVYHVSCPKLVDPHFIKTMRTMIDSCFKRARDSKITTLAFPSIGGGGLKYPRKDFAESLVASFKKQASKMKKPHLKTVFVVLHPTDSLTRTAFSEVISTDPDSAHGYNDIENDAGSARKVVHEMAIRQMMLRVVLGDITAERPGAVVRLVTKGSKGKKVKHTSLKPTAVVLDPGSSYKAYIDNCFREANSKGCPSIAFAFPDGSKGKVSAWTTAILDAIDRQPAGCQLRDVRLVDARQTTVDECTRVVTEHARSCRDQSCSVTDQEPESKNVNEQKVYSAQSTHIPVLEIYSESESAIEAFMRAAQVCAERARNTSV